MDKLGWNVYRGKFLMTIPARTFFLVGQLWLIGSFFKQDVSAILMLIIATISFLAGMLFLFMENELENAKNKLEQAKFDIICELLLRRRK